MVKSRSAAVRWKTAAAYGNALTSTAPTRKPGVLPPTLARHQRPALGSDRQGLVEQRASATPLMSADGHAGHGPLGRDSVNRQWVCAPIGV